LGFKFSKPLAFSRRKKTNAFPCDHSQQPPDVLARSTQHFIQIATLSTFKEASVLRWSAFKWPVIGSIEIGELTMMMLGSFFAVSSKITATLTVWASNSLTPSFPNSS
jgi:hypothetical protein